MSAVENCGDREGESAAGVDRFEVAWG